MKFGQLIEYNKINNSLKNHVKNEVGRLVPDLFFLFQKALYEEKASGLQLSFNIFREPSTWHTVKTNYKKL